MTILKQLLGEAFYKPPAHNAGNLNHTAVTRNAADAINADLGVQLTDQPSDFEMIITAGSTLRRKVKSVEAAMVGVPINLEDLLQGKFVAASVVDQVNKHESMPDDNSFEDGTVVHPEKTHNDHASQYMQEMVRYLIS